MTVTDFDVVIVGYGPVGHVAAALLGRQGHRIAVFDRQTSRYPLPRIGHLDHEVMRIVQAVSPGAADRFEREAVVCETYDWINAKGEVLIHFDWSTPEITGWHPHYLFYQPDLDEILAAAVEVLPNVAVHRGWEAVDVQADPDSVRLTMLDRAAGTSRTVSSRYLIGADGANSFVRRCLGIGWEDLGFQADWLVVDYRPNDPEAEIAIPIAGQLCDPARPTSMFRRIGHKHCRWEFMLLPGETRESMEKPERIWELLSRWVRPEDGTLVRHAVYTFHSGLADQWRRGRTLLIGDAAHLMPPFLGQGMGSGFRDAINLAWKLNMVLTGTAEETILDSYEEERKPHVGAIIGQAVELGKIVCISDPAEAAKRDEALIAGGGPPPPPFPTLAGEWFHQQSVGSMGYLAGELGPQGWVAFQGRSGRFDDVLGHGWALILFDGVLAEQVSSPQRESFSQLGGRIVVLQLPGAPHTQRSVVDTKAVYHNYFVEKNIVAVLVRPDFYVFGAARTAAELFHMMSDCCSHTLALRTP